MSVGFFRHWFIMYHSTTCLFSPTCFHHWFTYMLSHTELQLRPGGAGKKSRSKGWLQGAAAPNGKGAPAGVEAGKIQHGVSMERHEQGVGSGEEVK